MPLEKCRSFRYNALGQLCRFMAAQWGEKPREWVTVMLLQEAKSDVLELSAASRRHRGAVRCFLPARPKRRAGICCFAMVSLVRRTL